MFKADIFKQFTVVFVLFAALFIAPSACKQTGADNLSNEQTREVTDDAGRRVRVPVKIERVVSLAPNLTENVFAVGAGERLVGVTTYCNYPEDAKKIQKIGDTISPNLETIVALKPQLVLVSTASQIESFTRRMEEQKIPVYITNPKTFEDVLKNLRDLGDLLGTKDKAEKLAKDLEARVGDVEARVGNQNQVRVFVQISREPLFTIGRDSFVTNLIDRAGGVSVTDDVPEAYPKISKETALAAEPEAIILSVDDSMGEGNNVPADALKDSPAAKNNRVYKINGDWLTRPGPRLVDGLEAIAKALHPNAF